MMDVPRSPVMPRRGNCPVGNRFRGDLFLAWVDCGDAGVAVCQETPDPRQYVDAAWGEFLRGLAPGSRCLWLYCPRPEEWVVISRWGGGPQGGPVLNDDCPGIMAQLLLHALCNLPQPPEEEL